MWTVLKQSQHGARSVDSGLGKEPIPFTTKKYQIFKRRIFPRVPSSEKQHSPVTIQFPKTAVGAAVTVRAS